MYKFITGLLVVTVLTPFISYAALTDSQMQTVLSLLSSYSVDQSTMQDVQRSLSGTVLGATTACPILTTTLQRGMKDVTTNGQVTELQKFLAAYYGLSELDTVTGYFGVVTQRTVGRFQTEQGLSPVGIVGPQTRAKIAAVCSGGSTTTTILPKPGPICPAIAYTPIECATGSLSARYDANGCQNGWICTATATTTASTLSVSLDASSPGFQLVPGGATNIIVGAYKVRATGEAIQLQKLSLKLTAGISSDLNKVTLWDGSTKVGEAFFIGGATTATSVFTQSVLVPQNTDKVITVKADFSLIGTGEPVSVSGHLVQIDYQNGQGLGMTSGLPIFSVGSTAVAGVRVLKSFPATVTNLSSSLTAGGLVDGRLMRFSITADTRGPIGLTQLFVNVAPTGAQVSNVNIYGYEDSGFSTPISGVTSSGALRSTDECPTGCTSNNTANIGITTSGGTPTAIQIPAGSTRYFEVRGSVTGIQTGASVTSRLVGDGVFSGPASATSFVGKDAHFIWSPNSTTTARRSDQDWFTGYGIVGLPSTGLTHTRTSGTVTPPSSISVTAPNGGEQWELGTMNTITWSPYGYNPDVNPALNVKAYLERKDGINYVVVGTVLPSGKASIHWDGQINTSGTYPTPGSYYIRVLNTVTGQSDRSDAPFTITPRSVDLKINGSDGPITVNTNNPVTVTWTSSNVTRCELHNLYTDATRQAQVGSVPLSGTRQVYVSTFESYPALYCYRSDGSTRYDSVKVGAQQSFSSIQVLTPNGGEQIKIGEPYNISWKQTGLTNVSIALYSNDQWKDWIVKDFLTQFPNDSYIYQWRPAQTDTDIARFKIYITGNKADGTGYVDDKSDSPFSFVGATPPPPPPTGSAAVTSWKAYSFATKKAPPCSGNRYVGYSQKYGVWVGAVLCGSNTTYKLYMSGTETGTYLQIADYAGHGQDQCELVNPTFTLPNEDDITSGTCKNCAIGGVVDVQDEQVYARSRLGELFTSVTSRFWADLTTNSYSCGVAIAPTITVPGPVTPVPLTPSTPFSGTLEP